MPLVDDWKVNLFSTEVLISFVSLLTLFDISLSVQMKYRNKISNTWNCIKFFFNLKSRINYMLEIKTYSGNDYLKLKCMEKLTYLSKYYFHYFLLWYLIKILYSQLFVKTIKIFIPLLNDITQTNIIIYLFEPILILN